MGEVLVVLALVMIVGGGIAVAWWNLSSRVFPGSGSRSSVGRSKGPRPRVVRTFGASAGDATMADTTMHAVSSRSGDRDRDADSISDTASMDRGSDDAGGWGSDGGGDDGGGDGSGGGGD